MDKTIANFLTKGGVMLTANRRLASYFSKQYDRYQQAQNYTTWKTPDILPLESWVIRTWQNFLEQGLVEPLTLLSAHQEHALWRQIINASALTNELLHLSGAIKTAQLAWRLIREWRLPFQEKLFAENPDTKIFFEWATTYQRHCKLNKLITIRELYLIVNSIYENNLAPLPANLALAGFDEIPPLSAAILQTFSKNGCQYINFTEKSIVKNISKVAFPTINDELEWMAHWAKKLLYKNPHTRIGCIIPNLSECRDDVLEIFAKIFFNKEFFSEVAIEDMVNISAGKALYDYPVIHTAFTILEIVQSAPSVNSINYLIRSPFIEGSESEMMERHKLENKLIGACRGQHKIEFAEFLLAVNQETPILFNRLRQLQAHYINKSSSASASVWAKFFAATLKMMGWPGERKLNSTEYQLVHRWHELLQEFTYLDWATDPMSLGNALLQLKEMALNTSFQPQSAPAPIQILGLLEASGMQFDHLWLLGLHDGVFPAPAKPNPFIPMKLQREYNLPHASAEREFHFAQLLLQRFCTSAPEIIFSYPQQEQDCLLRPSPLLREIEELTLKELLDTPEQTIAETIFNSSLLETFCDDFAPPLATDITVKGGTALFKQQAQCPFRAFALLRLKTQTTNMTEPGLSALERGSFLHQILDKLWQSLADQTTLCGLNNHQLNDIIGEAITNTLFSSSSPLKHNLALLRIEQKRLEKIIIDWLELEKKRPYFRVIATEQRKSITLGNLEFTVQIDRIDELADGTVLIIDYKTNFPSVQDWFGERPDDPQLPIYCVSQSEPISGLAFAQINSEKVTFKGISEQLLPIEGINPLIKIRSENNNGDWLTQLEIWRQVLQALAEQFQRGYAKVDPKEGKKSCQFCELTPLCRIHERN
jgi:probable DNA repair protein